MNAPKVSVVTVCYHAVDTIEKTILSVVHQTYQNIEYIVIDGGSKDGTVDIVSKYRDRIAYFVSERDQGIYDAGLFKELLQAALSDAKRRKGKVMTFFCDEEYEKAAKECGLECIGNYLCYKTRLN